MARYYSWICILILGFLCQLSVEEAQSHKHRLHHGADRARSRSRRFGEGTPGPIMLSYVSERPTDTYYKIDEVLQSRSPGSHQNSYKPYFKECLDYSVEEEQPPGTSVMTVKAYDLDPPEIGGTILYSVVCQDEATCSFTVDNVTGLVTTKKVFNRDEPTRDIEFYVTVRATDNGSPQLDAVCTMKVTVLDINDNRPKWLKNEYRESIPVDFPIGQTVMQVRATDIDRGFNGSISYQLEPGLRTPSDMDYFRVEPLTGKVILAKKMEVNKTEFHLRAVATDQGDPPKIATTDLAFLVVESYKKTPTFEDDHPTRITLPEKNVDQNKPILTLTAKSNVVDQLVFFELVNGQTQPTNKDAIFTLETVGNVAYLKLDKNLDYETVPQYTLTIRAWNKFNLATETSITVVVLDENDEKPYFTDVVSGIILENEPAGTSVMRARAIDIDGTSPNNEVSYYLKDDEENFSIDQETGEIKTRKEFDREVKDVYQLTVIARDGAPSALPGVTTPNERPQTLKIEIADVNDNAPTFAKPLYEAEMREDANVNNLVIELVAKDVDTAAFLTYSILSGNEGDAFSIVSSSNTASINLKNELDYEKVREYKLVIRVTDSMHDADTIVHVLVINVNDNPPVFEDMNTVAYIVEESIPKECIFRLKAYDPDIADRSQPQNLTYFIEKGVEHFSVDDKGCMRVIKPIDRDPPNGYYTPFGVQIFVGVVDEWGISSWNKKVLKNITELTVQLRDINDNAPFLNCTNPVVWKENQPRGTIIQLSADDYDTPANGPPFKFSIAPSADPEILSLFAVHGKAFMANKDNFDREERKQYLVPIQITDSGTPEKTGTSVLTVIIGDENDNRMKYGESKIFVYKYKENLTFKVGRVYVEDKDDWDLPDKTFTLLQPNHPYFSVDSDTGDIFMKPDAPEKTHELLFKVQDSFHGDEVNARVNVTVKPITDEAIINSGSIRFMGITKEQFIKPEDGVSRKDLLQASIANLCGVPFENVDIFTVNNSPQNPDLYKVDVRYSVHNSPYWPSEKLDGIMGLDKERLQDEIKLNIMMIRIDECLSERHHCPMNSCTNTLKTSEISYKIYTNTSSFVGVNSFIEYECKCKPLIIAPNSCQPNPCLNSGSCHSGGGMDGFRCECQAGFEGPLCEKTNIYFQGADWAWYEPLSVCNNSVLQLQFRTDRKNGLILYSGPLYKSAMNVTDFMSLELRNGRPVLRMDYGTGLTTVEVVNSPNLGDNKFHFISLTWNPTDFRIRIDNCIKSDERCYGSSAPRGTNSYLNVNGPLQLGGLSFNPTYMKNFMDWNDDTMPTRANFTGCIANVTFNGKYYNLGDPSFSGSGNVTTCDAPNAAILTTSLGVDVNFIIILLVCILVLLLLVVAIVFYKRRRSYEEVKGDLSDDVRENIINYSDEGGGEEDQTGYNLSILLKATTGSPYIKSPTDKIPLKDIRPQGLAPDSAEGPDIQSFLQGNKNKVDNDPDGLPYDDVRNYAYEGDGNSMGSLSSLASGTDDEDLNFDYLPTFGPRFKKLADMYGGQSSDDESYTGAPPEAWC